MVTYIATLLAKPGHELEVSKFYQDLEPLMREARSEQRKAATLPTSSIVTERRSGACCSTWSSILRKLAIPAAARVLIGPAEIALTRVPSGPRL